MDLQQQRGGRGEREQGFGVLLLRTKGGKKGLELTHCLNTCSWLEDGMCHEGGARCCTPEQTLWDTLFSQTTALLLNVVRSQGRGGDREKRQGSGLMHPGHSTTFILIM
jgi:hypothetical protein